MYEKLNIPCSVRKELSDLADKITFTYVPYMHVGAVPPELIAKDKLLSILVQEFKPSVHMYKFLTNTWVNWHTDVAQSRQCAFNMLVKGTFGHTLFATRKIVPSIFEVHEMQYESDYLYIFDTQKPHAVLNLKEERILLSIGINKSYAEVYERCKEMKLISGDV